MLSRKPPLALYYEDRISGELFAEEEQRIQASIEALRSEAERTEEEVEQQDQLLEQFEQVAALLREMDVEVLWEAATPEERRVLVVELVEEVAVLPDHVEVTVAGAPRLNVRFEEVGLKESQIVGVGGGNPTSCTPPLWSAEWAA